MTPIHANLNPFSIAEINKASTMVLLLSYWVRAMNDRLLSWFTTAVCLLCLSLPVQAQNDGGAPPPTVLEGANTSAPIVTEDDSEVLASDPVDSEAGADRLFGSTTITEHKRENGQVYAIEIEHSSGSKQFIEETDADGLSNSKTKDLEEEPNIAKWRLGSW